MGFFVYDQPLSAPRCYFGRERLLRSLRDGVAAGRSFCVCGGPRTGRTSTLLQLERAVRHDWQRARTARLVAVYVDVAACGAATAGARALRMWQALTGGLRDAAVQAGRPVPALADPLLGRAPKPWTALRDAVARLDEALAGSGAWSRYAWLLDGACRLLGPDREEEAALVRDMITGALRGGPVAVVLGGGRALRESLGEEHGPFRSARPVLLAPLDEAEARALVRAGLPRADGRLVDELLRLSGRHPYVLQRLSAELEGQATGYDPGEALARAGADLAALWGAVWAELDLGRGLACRGVYAAPEHALMQLLVDAGAPLDVRTAERQLGLRPLGATAELLEYLGVAERVLRADTPLLRAHAAAWNAWYSARVLA